MDLESRVQFLIGLDNTSGQIPGTLPGYSVSGCDVGYITSEHSFLHSKVGHLDLFRGKTAKVSRFLKKQNF